MREPGHYYTSYFVSLAAGFSPPTALRHAVFSQMPDEVNALDAKFQEENRLGAPGGMVTWTQFERDLVQRGLHSVTGGLSDTERGVTRKALRQTTPGTMEFGFLLHRFGDTYAHSVIGNETRMYDTGLGHAGDLNDPDLIHVRPGLFTNLVVDLYGVLSELARAQGQAPRMTTEQVRSVAMGVANTKVTELVAYPGPGLSMTPAVGFAVSNDASESAQIQVIRTVCRQTMHVELDPYKPESEDTMSWSRFKQKHAQFMHQLDGSEIAWSDVVAAVHTVAQAVGQEPKHDLNYPLRPQ